MEDTRLFVERYNNVFISKVTNISVQQEILQMIFCWLIKPPVIHQLFHWKAQTANLKQPGVIEAFKHYYRKVLLHMVKIGKDNEKNIQQLYNKINLKDIVYMTAEAKASILDSIFPC